MARGGKRPGAGRPKGAISKSTRALQEAAQAGGEMPLDYMLRVMRSDNAPVERRDDMAKAAAPYSHAKLQATTITGKDGGPVQTEDVSGLELARRVAFLLMGAKA